MSVTLASNTLNVLTITNSKNLFVTQRGKTLNNVLALFSNYFESLQLELNDDEVIIMLKTKKTIIPLFYEGIIKKCMKNLIVIHVLFIDF